MPPGEESLTIPAPKTKTAESRAGTVSSHIAPKSRYAKTNQAQKSEKALPYSFDPSTLPLSFVVPRCLPVLCK